MNARCAEVASPTIATAAYILLAYWANITGVTHIAHSSMVNLRALFTLAPRLMSVDDNQPPAMLPRSERT